MDIANERYAANVLRMLSVWQGDAFVVGEVWTIVLPLAALDHARDFRNDICWSLVDGHEMHGARRSALAVGGTFDGHCCGFQRMFGETMLVAVRRHAEDWLLLRQ